MMTISIILYAVISWEFMTETQWLLDFYHEFPWRINIALESECAYRVTLLTGLVILIPCYVTLHNPCA